MFEVHAKEILKLVRWSDGKYGCRGEDCEKQTKSNKNIAVCMPAGYWERQFGTVCSYCSWPSAQFDNLPLGMRPLGSIFLLLATRVETA